MDIYRAERLAQDRMTASNDWDKSFTLVGPRGVVSCEWLDPFFGLFQIKGSDGFMMTKQIPSSVEVLMPEDNSVAAHEQKFGEKLYRDDALDLAWAAIDATKSDGGVVADTPSNETATEVMAHPSPMGSRSCDEKTIACGVAGVAPGPSEHYRVPTNCVCCHGPLDHNRQCPICDFAPGPSDSAPNHQPHAVSQGTSPELLALIERAKSHVMTPEEQYEQRRSFVRGMCPFNRDYASWCAEVDRLLPPLASPAKTGGAS